ncbi:MAG: fibronectin type III domain-containing protein [Micromonosporaceae bacterium]|nr:fibronectin type III domain-containing protein [Micromonosporaceae bacterium]
MTISVVAVLVATVSVLVAIAVPRLLDQSGGSPDSPGDPSDQVASASAAPARTPPTDLQLKDNGTSITVTWRDPAAGQVPFIVAGGPGTDLRTQRTTRETTFTLNGLNPRLNYCFTVAAVYDVNHVAVSDLVCTRRSSPSATKPPSSAAAKPRKSSTSDS